jgi:hypothetical protein
MVRMSICLLGPFEAQRGGRLLDDREWRCRQSRTILQVLLNRRNSAVPANQLPDISWPDAELSAAGAHTVSASTFYRTDTQNGESWADPGRLLQRSHDYHGDFTPRAARRRARSRPNAPLVWPIAAAADRGLDPLRSLCCAEDQLGGLVEGGPEMVRHAGSGGSHTGGMVDTGMNCLTLSGITPLSDGTLVTATLVGSDDSFIHIPLVIGRL